LQYGWKNENGHLTGFLGQQYQTIEDNSEDGEQTEDMEDDTSSAPEWSIDSDSEHELQSLCQYVHAYCL